MWKMSVLMPDWAGLVRNERCLMQMDDIAILRMNWSNGGSVGRQSERLVGDVTGMAARRPVVTLPTAVPTTSTATSRTINENPPIDKLIIGRAVSGLRNKWAERVALTTFATEATNEQTNKQTNKKTNRNGTNNDDNNSDNNQKEQEDETNETHFKKNVPSECIELKIKRKHPSPIRRSERAFGMEIDGKNDNKKNKWKRKSHTSFQWRRRSTHRRPSTDVSSRLMDRRGSFSDLKREFAQSNQYLRPLILSTYANEITHQKNQYRLTKDAPSIPSCWETFQLYRYLFR